MKRENKVVFDMAALAVHAAQPPGCILSMPRAEAGNVAAMLDEIKVSVKGMREEVLPKAEAALKAAQKTGELSAELKAQIDDLLPKFNEQSNAQSKLEGKLEALESRATDVEQLVAEGGRNAKGLATTVGQELAESEAVKAYLANGVNGSKLIAVKAAITTANGDAGGLIWSDREETPVRMARRRLLLRSALNVVNTSAASIDYTRQTTRTNAAAPVAEAASAPESDYGWEKASVQVKKIAHVSHISEEAMADATQLQGEIDSEMRYGLDLEEEEQVLLGDGTGDNLNGLVTQATAFSAAAGLPNTQAIDRLRLAMLQVVLNDYAADTFVLNPVDWAGIELLKDGEMRYLFGIPSMPEVPALWRLPVIESNSMSANNWLCGAMFMAATLYDRQQNEVLFSTEHGTNFVDGMVTAKAMKRVALAVKRPSSLITGNFTFA